MTLTRGDSPASTASRSASARAPTGSPSAIDFPAVVDALANIGFAQWAELETDCPSGSVEKDMATNLAYIRGVMSRRAAQA